MTSDCRRSAGLPPEVEATKAAKAEESEGETLMAKTPREQSIEALQNYMDLCDDVSRLEARENECTCVTFEQCRLCIEITQANQAAKKQLDLWGYMWARQLFQIQEQEKRPKLKITGSGSTATAQFTDTRR